MEDNCMFKNGSTNVVVKKCPGDCSGKSSCNCTGTEFDDFQVSVDASNGEASLSFTNCNGTCYINITGALASDPVVFEYTTENVPAPAPTPAPQTTLAPSPSIRINYYIKESNGSKSLIHNGSSGLFFNTSNAAVVTFIPCTDGRANETNIFDASGSNPNVYLVAFVDTDQCMKWNMNESAMERAACPAGCDSNSNAEKCEVCSENAGMPMTAVPSGQSNSASDSVDGYIVAVEYNATESEYTIAADGYLGHGDGNSGDMIPVTASKKFLATVVTLEPLTSRK